jgi:hypothetical protein
MRSSFLSSARLSPILLLILLVLSTQTLWAQRTSPLEESAVARPGAPAPVATVSEGQTPLHLKYNGLPLAFEQNQAQTEAWMRLFPDNTNAVPGQDAGTVKFWGKDRYFMGSASTKSMTFASTYGHVHHETIHGNDLEYYGRHIPWAGSVVLRIGQQAKVHPHIAAVLKMVRPQF